MTHRRLVPADDAFRTLATPEGLAPIYRRMFVEAGVAAGDRADRDG